MKKFFVVFVIIGVVFALSACGSESASSSVTDNMTSSNNNSNNQTSGETRLSGTVTVSGSTSVEKIGVATAEEFMALNPDVKVTYEGIGSSNGVKNAKDGVTQIGTASRNLKTEEKTWGLTEVPIAYDGVAVITHPENQITGLSIEQVQKIFKGEITNWSKVGGKDGEIVVVSREEGSGTRGAFEELVKFEDELTQNATVVEGNGGVQTTVASNPNAIGYVSFTYINETVKPMLVDSIEPTTANVLTGDYKISRPFLMIYKDENMDDASKAFVEFILSTEGQNIVSDKGGIPVK